MFISVIYNNPSRILLLKAKIAQHVGYYLHRVKIAWLYATLVGEFKSTTDNILSKIQKANMLSATKAKNELHKVQTTLVNIEKLSEIVEKINIPDVTANFKIFKKTTFKYEARLHKIAYADVKVIPTSDELKAQLSDLGIKSV